jgi:putative ABC transport system substrate-binding protein
MDRIGSSLGACITLVGLLVANHAAAPFAAGAQPLAKIPRVGLLRPGSPPDPYVEAFRQGLRDLGYVEGQTIAIEYRWAEGSPARIPLLAGWQYRESSFLPRS